jgi:hypothetical protein
MAILIILERAAVVREVLKNYRYLRILAGSIFAAFLDGGITARNDIIKVNMII